MTLQEGSILNLSLNDRGKNLNSAEMLIRLNAEVVKVIRPEEYVVLYVKSKF